MQISTLPILSYHSTGDIDRLNIGQHHSLLGDGDGEDAVLHGGFHLLDFGVLRQAEPPKELAAAPLDAVPGIGLLLAFLVPLAADLEDAAVLHLHLDLLLPQSGQIGCKHVGLGGLLPVDTGGG
ncbi:unnamed protein product [Musa hybrid cultivar]